MGDITVITFFTIVGILIVLLLIFIKVAKRKKPTIQLENPAGGIQSNPSSLTTSEVLAQFELRFPEFTNLLRLCSRQVALDELIKQDQVRSGFDKLSGLCKKRKKIQQKGMVMTTSLRLSQEDLKEAKAAMITIVKALYDFEGIEEKLGNDFKESTDKFLNSIK